MKKIAIYGAGSLGTILGAYLRQAGIDVDLISRNKDHVEALNREGATIVGTVNKKVPVRALLPEEMTEMYDLIFLATKQLHNQEIVKGLVPFLKPEGILCTMQNGLPDMEIADIIGEKRIMGCTVGWGATLLSPGVAELTSDEEHLTFGLGSVYKIKDDKLKKVKRILEQIGPVEVVDNFIGMRWTKLLVSSTFSGMSAVLGCNYGEVVDQKFARRCAIQIIKECMDVAKAQGITVESIQGKDIEKLFYYKGSFKRFFAYHQLPKAINKHRLVKASMLQDIQKGRPCEIDAINGIVSKYGKRYQIPTPYCDQVVEIVHGIEQGKYHPCFDNIKLFT